MRSLQNNMSQGYNRYPINKLVAYTMISKFVPEKKPLSNPNIDTYRNRDTTTTNISYTSVESQWKVLQLQIITE